MTLRNIFGYSGSVATGFIIIDELTGIEPDKRAEECIGRRDESAANQFDSDPGA